jgi:N-acetylneuraminic acid mutarotase
MSSKKILLPTIIVLAAGAWYWAGLSTPSAPRPVGMVAEPTVGAPIAANPSDTGPVKATPPTTAISDQRKVKATALLRKVTAEAAVAEAPESIKAFRGWTKRYFLAEPEQQQRLIPEGKTLAQEHRVALGRLIPSSPFQALEYAVPMVVRQDLPAEVVAQLEQRVNARGALMVAGVMPLPGAAQSSPSVLRRFTPEGQDPKAPQTVLTVYPYGGRLMQHSLDSTRVNGIAIDSQLALRDSSVRQLEVGERPDAAKEAITSCPISGIDTPIERTEMASLPPIEETTPAIEDHRTIRFVCSGGHIQEYASNLTEEEREAYWKSKGVAAEGATGGASFTFNPPPGWTTGTSSLLYVRCTYPDQMNDPQSEAECYANLKQTTDYFMENSRGRFYLTPTVAPLVVLPHPESWYLAADNGEFLAYNHALAGARRMGFDTDNFDLDVVRYDKGPGSFGGLGSLGGKLVILRTSSVGVLMHEIGHNLGLMHSNYWRTVPASTVGAGQNDEYGNKFDVMGGSGSLGHYVAPHKAQINWLTPDQYHDVRSNGIYRIYQTDQGQADAGKRYALKVERDSERNFWLEFRQQFTQPAMANGLMLTWDAWGAASEGTTAGSNRGAQLIDTTPGSGTVANTLDDAAIVVGRTFSDPVIDLHITPIRKVTTGIPYIDVEVNRGPFPGNVPPSLSITASGLTPGVAAAINLTASGSDANGDTVVYYWDFGDGSFSTDGVRTQAKAWTTAGRYRVTCTASDSKGGKTIRGLLVTVGSIPSGSYTVSGRVLDASNQPMAGVYIANRVLTSTPAQGNVQNFRYAITDSNGAYTLTNLPAGSLTFTPHLPPLTFAPNFPVPLNVQADNSNCNLAASAGPVGQTITVAVVDGAAGEIGSNTASFTITRSGPVNAALDVPFMLGSSGTANRGTDYTLNPNPTLNTNNGMTRFTIPATQQGITVTLTAANDGANEGEEYAVLELPDANQGFTRVGPTTITIPIADDDSSNPVVTLIQSEPSASEAGDSASFIVRRNGPTTSPLTVNLGYSGTAGINTDVLGPTTVVIPAGSNSAAIALAAFDDIFAEGTEFGTISLSNSPNYQRDTVQRTAQFYITDNDQPVLTITAPDAVAAEVGNNNGKFTISRVAKDVSQALIVQFSLSGDALHGTDYRRIDGSAIIPAHELSVDIEIIPMDDGIDELDQTVVCRLATDDAYAITSPGGATVTIADNDESEFTIRALPGPNGNRVVEPLIGNGSTDLFRVSRPAAGTSATVNIVYTGTTANNDFSAPNSVNFAAADLFKDVAVTITNDNASEDLESLIATISVAAPARLGRERVATVMIMDGDQPTVDVAFADTEGTGTVAENDGTFRLYFRRTNANLTNTYTGDLDVPFTLTGTAGVNVDYTLPSQTARILGGQAGVFVTVTLTNDVNPEGTETIIVTLGNSSAWGYGNRTTTIRVEDNDPYIGVSAPSVQFAATTSMVNERTGNAGTVVQIPVNITGTRSGPTRVDYYVSSSEALGTGVDYTMAAGSLTFSIADTSKNITFTTTPDIVPEGNEDVVITLTNNIGVNIGANDDHTITITDLAVPECLTDVISGLPGGSAMLRGKAVANGVATNAWFEWRRSDQANYTSTPAQAIGTGHSLTALADFALTGMVYPGTYYYRTVAQNSMGVSRGITRTIRTAAPPVVLTLPTTIHDASSATLIGSVNPNRLNAEVWFEWGTSLAYGNVTPLAGVVASTTAVTVQIPITGLTQDTLYHYRFVARTALGTVQGLDRVVSAVPQKVAGDLLVNITANQPSAGAASWINQGLLGNFTRSGSVLPATPLLGGIAGVGFNGVNTRYTGAAPSADISGNDSRTIEAWVLNPGLGDTDAIISWGRNLGAQQTSLLYNNSSSGAMQHGAMTGSAAYAVLPTLNRWHHLVYTYAAGKAKLYVDGVLKNTVTTGIQSTAVDPILLGSTADASGVAQAPTFHGYLNALRIHGGELLAADVAKNFLLGPAAPPAPLVPIATTLGASAITNTTATLNAQVAPRGAATTAWIEWGTSTSYDNATPPQTAGAGWAHFDVVLPIAGLAAGAEYHYRVVAQNSLGVVNGVDKVFTTTALANSGILWVDLRAGDFVNGSPWHNRGALGDFDALGAPTAELSAMATGRAGVNLAIAGSGFESQALADADIAYNGDRTIELWVNSAALSNPVNTLLHQGSRGLPHGSFQASYGSTTSWFDNTTTVPWTAAPSAGSWHHVAYVHSGTQVITYLDGVAVATTAVSTGSNTLSNKLLIGLARDAAGLPITASETFSGVINAVRVHGGLLTPAQVANNFQAGPGGVGGDLPVVMTLAASSITSSSATLNASVSASGATTTVHFEWGTSASFGNLTPATMLSNTFQTQPLTGLLGGLTSGQTYHYRAVATNGSGTITGSTLTFVAAGSSATLPTSITAAVLPADLATGKATLRGTATPGSTAAQAWFEYGPTATLGMSTAKVAITVTTVSKAMVTPVLGLLPHAAYHYRLVTSNAAGAVAGATLTFNSLNAQPIALAGAVTIKEDVATVLALKASDADKEPLTIVVTTPPMHGSLTGNSLTPFYSPALHYSGSDSFQFMVTDGVAFSPVVTFNITITAVDDGPVANGQTLAVNEDVALPITFTGQDPDSPAVVPSYEIATQPSHGSLSVLAGAGVTYTPTANFVGTDFFTFIARDGLKVSAPAEIVIFVSPVQDAPQAVAVTIGTNVNTIATGFLSGVDVDGNALTFASPALASHGDVTVGPDGAYSYDPDTGYIGNDSFTFTVNDGTVSSASATVNVIVGGPSADGAVFTGYRDDLLVDVLTATDPNSVALTFTIESPPSHGAVTIDTDGTFRYNPSAGFIGTDHFSFSVNNGTLDSPPAEVTLVITERPADWVWRDGAKLPKQVGVYGTLNVEAAANTPGARTESAGWRTATGDLLIFGGMGLGSSTKVGPLNDLWKRSAITNEWTWIGGSQLPAAAGTYGAQGSITPTNQPGARQGAVRWVGADGRLWMFGGLGRDSSATGLGLLNDLWVYDPSISDWSWKKGSNFINANGSYGTKGIDTSTSSPGARTGAVGWTDARGNLWMFGGSGRAATGTVVGNLSDLWRYEVATNRWTWISGGSALDSNGIYGTKGITGNLAVPGGRSFATGWTSSQGSLFLFGGAGKGAVGTAKGNLNDLWTYDPNSNTWTWLTGSNAINGVASYGTLMVASPTNTPGARSGAASWLDTSGVGYVFGGQGSAALNDLWSFDELSQHWIWSKGPSTPNGAANYGVLNVGAPGNTPGARRGALSLVGGDGSLMLFGGTNSTNSNNDLWSLTRGEVPVFVDARVNSLTGTSLDLDFTLRPNGHTGTVQLIEYSLGGPPVAIDTLDISPTPEMVDTFSVSGLTAGTTYHYQLLAETEAGVGYSRWITVQTTGAAVAPDVEFANATQFFAEASGMAHVRVVLSAPAPQAFTVPLTWNGTATAVADYLAPAPSVAFTKGQTEAVISIPVVSDGNDEPDETLVFTLGAPSAVATLGTTTDVIVTITDDEVLPAITSATTSNFFALGSPITLNVTATGSNLLYAWKKNGVAISKATAPTYTIPVATLASAGAYTCEVKNALDTLFTAPTEVFIIDQTNKRSVFTAGASTTLKASAMGPPSVALEYQWQKDTFDQSDVTGHIVGSLTNSLAITGLVDNDSAVYRCRISKQGTPALAAFTGLTTMAVPTFVPELTTIVTLPPGVVGTAYSYQVAFDANLLKAPNSFTALGLPSGLTISSTGLISGKPRTPVASQVVTVIARNAIGPSVDQTPSISVLALPSSAVGSFVATVDSLPGLANFGGRLDLTTTASGSFTAKLILQSLTATSTGIVVPSITGGVVTEVTGGAVVKVGTQLVPMTFSIDPVTHEFDGTLNFGLAGTTDFAGYHLSWNKTTAPATNREGIYTVALDLPSEARGLLSVPQGSGYATAKVGLDGKVAITGKAADGLAFTVATILGPVGEVPVFAAFKVSPGSLVGELAVTTAIPLTNNTVAGDLTWAKAPAPAKSKDYGYRAGFAPVELIIDGGKYLPLAPGAVVMGLPNTNDNAALGFTEGGLIKDLTTPALSQGRKVVFSIRNPGAALVQTVTVPVNPELTTFKLTATTGAFAGTFTLGHSVKTLVRKVTYQGQIVHLGSNSYRSAGYFLLHQLPQPGQTLVNSPVLSGDVQLGPPVSVP